MQLVARASMARRALTALVTLAIAILGFVSLDSLRLELIPATNYPVAVVVGTYPGASPQVVEEQVTKVIEAAVLGVEKVQQVSSTATSNISSTTIQFEFGTRLTTAVEEVRAAVSAAQQQLPEEVGLPQVVAGSLADYPILRVAVAGDADAAALANTVKTILVPELNDVAGVRSVAVYGQAPREIHLEVDADELQESGVETTRILELLDDYGLRLPGGTITENDKTISVQAGSPLQSVDELGTIPLTDRVRLSDVAEVIDRAATAGATSRLNGEPALTLSITKVPDATVIEVSDAVQQTLASLSDRLAAQDVEATIIFNQAPFIQESLQGLAFEGLLGLGFAVLVILMFLTSVRSTLVSAVAIPLSLLTTFIVMLAVSYSLNLLTLAALTISVGRVVDDAIVVIENISRHLSYGESRRQAVITATTEVGGAITAATLATVAVFAPMAFVGGFAGELFRPFVLTVAIAMLASLFVALTIVPVLAYWFLRSPLRTPTAAQSARALAEAKERHGLWQRGYVPTLKAALRRPVAMLLIAVILLTGSLALIPRLETNFLGGLGQDTLTVTQGFAPAISSERQAQAAHQVEEVLMALPEIDTVQTTISSRGTAGFSAGGTATFALTLADDADADAAPHVIRQALSGLATDPVTQITVSAGEAAGLGNSTVDLIVTADTPEALAEAAERVADAVAQADGVTDLTSTLAATQPVIQVTVDRDAAAKAGLTETEVAGTVAGLMYRAELGTLTLDGIDVPVTATFGSSPASIEELNDIKVTGDDGAVLLADIATIETVTGPAAITRSDGRRTVTVSVTPQVDDVGAVTADLTARVDALDLPAGATVSLGGIAADQAAAFTDLGLALVAAILIIYVVLVATFNSLLQPLILLVSIPFAAIGAIGSLLATGTPLGVPALIGLLMLVGVVVSNAIVLIDLINQYRRQGMPLNEAVLEGSRNRLRPILMTAAATIFALLPMAFGLTGGGAFISGPLAVVTIGGLLTSTLLTLYVVPVIYTLTHRRAERQLGPPPAPTSEATAGVNPADADSEAQPAEGPTPVTRSTPGEDGRRYVVAHP
ncbi:MAG: efflux RND transporter permease subunit [Propioniciclava sp.]